MKKTIAMLLAVVLAMGLLAGCGAKADDDWKYIQGKGKLTIGMTIFDPMNYYDENGKLIGFDTELAEAVCTKLGVEAEFVEIDWDQKVVELKGKSIDCIWNGMTIKDELKDQMDFSVPYSGNAQVCVINKKNADKYTDTASMAGAKIAAEGSSAGEDAIAADENLSKGVYVAVQAQRDTLLELKSGTVDVAVIDKVMALASVGEGTGFEDLMVVEGTDLSAEEYGIGMRKGSSLTEKVNQALKELAADGTVAALQEKYPSVLVILEE